MKLILLRSQSLVTCSQVRDAEKFPYALGFESQDASFQSVRKRGPCFTAVEEDEGDKRLLELELA